MSARHTETARETASGERPLAWPGDPKSVTAADIDFEALAHALANRCRFAGRTRQYHALAAHAAIVSEEIEALDGLEADDRRRLALHALIVDAPSAWLGEDPAASPGAAKLTAGIAGAVREAAGLDPVLADEGAELLRFVGRMTEAAERRDLDDTDAVPGTAFPPLRRRIRPVGPGRAAKLWLARFRALAEPRAGGEEAGQPTEDDGDGASRQAELQIGEDGRDEGRQAA